MRLTEAEKSMLNVEKKAKELIVQSQSYCSKECDSIKINFEGQLISLRGKCVCIDEKLEQHSQRLNILMDESERANRSSSSQCEKLGKRHDELAIGLDEKDQKLRALEKEVIIHCFVVFFVSSLTNWFLLGFNSGHCVDISGKNARK